MLTIYYIGVYCSVRHVMYFCVGGLKTILAPDHLYKSEINRHRSQPNPSKTIIRKSAKENATSNIPTGGLFCNNHLSNISFCFYGFVFWFMQVVRW